jgi:hypothetical protein
MVVKRGSVVGTEFGTGTVVAVTKEFVVVDIGGKMGEVALHREDSPVWLTPTEHVEGGGDEEVEIHERLE